MIPPLKTLLLASLLATTASHGAGCTSSAAPPTPANFVPRLDAAVCASVKRCAPEETFLACGDPSSGPHYDVAAEVTAGRVSFDAARADACLAALEGAACGVPYWDVLADPSSGCDAVLTGLVGAGGDCWDSTECASSLFCDVAAACPGKCAELGAEGTTCATETCAKGLYCKPSTKVCTRAEPNGTLCDKALQCASGFCATSGLSLPRCMSPVAPVPTDRGEGEGCNALHACTAGLYCQAPGYTCRSFLSEGEACGTNGDHAGTTTGCGLLACAGSDVDLFGPEMTVTPGVCRAWSDVGGPCESLPEGSLAGTSGCMWGLACGADHKCALAPSSGPCLKAPGAACAQGSWCDATDSTCQPSKASGASCELDGECKSQDCSAGVCVAACHAP